MSKTQTFLALFAQIDPAVQTLDRSGSRRERREMNDLRRSPTDQILGRPRSGDTPSCTAVLSPALCSDLLAVGIPIFVSAVGGHLNGRCQL
jgi:hypothetical protein